MLPLACSHSHWWQALNALCTPLIEELNDAFQKFDDDRCSLLLSEMQLSLLGAMGQ